MSDMNPVPTEREEIELLLPWYVTGKLDHDDQVQVAAYLERYPEMAAQIELIRQEQSEAIGANEAIVVPPARAFENLLAGIANNDRAPSRPFMSGFLDRISEFFIAPSAGAVRWAAAAAAVVVMVQAIAITTMIMRNDSSKTYQSASGETSKNAAAGTFVLVQFAGKAPAADVATALTKFSLVIVDGPKPGGLYKIRLDTKKISEAERDRRIAELRALPEVFSLVTPSN